VLDPVIYRSSISTWRGDPRAVNEWATRAVERPRSAAEKPRYGRAGRTRKPSRRDRALSKDRRSENQCLAAPPNEPLGRHRYWPIYEARRNWDLRSASIAAGMAAIPPTGGGWAVSFYTRASSRMRIRSPAQAVRVCGARACRALSAPLKIVFIEGGFGGFSVDPSVAEWTRTSTASRCGAALTRRPSEYVREHFWSRRNRSTSRDHASICATVDRLGRRGSAAVSCRISELGISTTRASRSDSALRGGEARKNFSSNARAPLQAL